MRNIKFQDNKFVFIAYTPIPRNLHVALQISTQRVTWLRGCIVFAICMVDSE